MELLLEIERNTEIIGNLIVAGLLNMIVLWTILMFKK